MPTENVEAGRSDQPRYTPEERAEIHRKVDEILDAEPGPEFPDRAERMVGTIEDYWRLMVHELKEAGNGES